MSKKYAEPRSRGSAFFLIRIADRIVGQGACGRVGYQVADEVWVAADCCRRASSAAIADTCELRSGDWIGDLGLAKTGIPVPSPLNGWLHRSAPSSARKAQRYPLEHTSNWSPSGNRVTKSLPLGGWPSPEDGTIATIQGEDPPVEGGVDGVVREVHPARVPRQACPCPFESRWDFVVARGTDRSKARCRKPAHR